MSLETLVETTKEKFTEYKLAKKNFTKAKVKLKQLTNQLETLEKFKGMVVLYAQQSLEETIHYIEETVTLALQSVFGDDYHAVIKLEQKRDQQEVYFILKKGDLELELRQDLTGVGEVDVYCYGLKMASFALEEDCAPILLLDEPIKYLSKDYLPQMAEVLKQSTISLDIQQIIISHEEGIIETADKIIKIGG
jgi:DNA repair protein SbcC/Rad50